MEWVHLAQDKVQWRAFVNAAMNTFVELFYQMRNYRYSCKSLLVDYAYIRMIMSDP
jgi:hypothetical protein